MERNNSGHILEPLAYRGTCMYQAWTKEEHIPVPTRWTQEIHTRKKLRWQVAGPTVLVMKGIWANRCRKEREYLQDSLGGQEHGKHGGCDVEDVLEACYWRATGPKHKDIWAKRCIKHEGYLSEQPGWGQHGEKASIMNSWWGVKKYVVEELETWWRRKT